MPPTPNQRPEALGDGQIVDDLKGEFQDLFGAAKDLAFTALQDKALNSVRDTVRGVTERLNEYVQQGGGSPGLIAAVTGAQKLAEGASPGRALLSAGATGLKEKVKGLFRRGGRAGGRKLKLTNIVESIDVGVPVRVAYNQWTQFSDFPRFMKKVENVDSPSDEKLNWKAQIWWSHRTWESNIIKQVPDERIIWRSKGQKGHVDGAVSFHELSPALTRILLVLEYHPQGIFEHTGNLWRAQGRRARLELKHFRRHVMTQVALHPDEVEGWRGVIEDGKVVKDHETALQEEKEREQEQAREEGLPE
ncbi:MAG TPA: SRPBCC family protein, partial [Streptosporangiaceae bacterium]|nr:SRPBCC family protein [Streptosporangiaceae bacterium]